MALPKRRISTRRKGKRRANPSSRVKLPVLTRCSSCGQEKLPHVICQNCKKY